MFNSCSAIQ